MNQLRFAGHNYPVDDPLGKRVARADLLLNIAQEL